MHITFSFPGFPKTPMTGDLSALFFWLQQYRPWQKSLKREQPQTSRAPISYWDQLAFPAGLCLSTHYFSVSTLQSAHANRYYIWCFWGRSMKESLMMYYQESVFIARESPPLIDDTILKTESEDGSYRKILPACFIANINKILCPKWQVFDKCQTGGTKDKV